MTISQLKNRARRYRSAYSGGECLFSRNIITPGRCTAAKLYEKQVNDFVDKEIKKSKDDTENNQPKLLAQRKKKKLAEKIYPINNHDFDYKTAMLNKKNRFSLGFSNKPTTDYLMTVPFKLNKYTDILVKDEYPNRNTRAGIDDILVNDTRKRQFKIEYDKMNQNLPYPSFRKDYPECRFSTKGKYSSSYFIRAGECPTSIDNKDKCEKKKFKWYTNKKRDIKNEKGEVTEKKDGACFKPRFLYIDNSAKPIFGKKGLIPSVLGDVDSITPGKLFEVLSGNNIEGGGILPCVEEFTNHSTEKTSSNILILLLFAFIIFYICNKKIIFYIK